MNDLSYRIFYTHIPGHRGPGETYKAVYEEEVAIEVEQERSAGKLALPEQVHFLRKGREVLANDKYCPPRQVESALDETYAYLRRSRCSSSRTRCDDQWAVVSLRTDQTKETKLTVHSTPKLSQKGQAWQNGFVAVSCWREVGRVAAPIWTSHGELLPAYIVPECIARSHNSNPYSSSNPSSRQKHSAGPLR